MFKIPKVQWPVFDSIRQAAAATKVPAAILALAKSSGCPAFGHGRIRFGEWIAWHFSQKKSKAVLPAGFGSWRDYLNSVAAARQVIALARDKDEVLDKQEVGTAIAAGISSLFSSIEQALTRDFPSQCAGLSESQIARRGSILVAQLEDECRESLSKAAGGPIPKREAVEFATQQAVDQVNHEKAFAEHCSSDWTSFVQWRETQAATTREKRAAWCTQRAAENQPVPDATEQELQEVEGLRKS